MLYLTGMDDDDFNLLTEPRCPIHLFPLFSSFFYHVFFLTFPFDISISFLFSSFFFPFKPQRLSMNDCFLFACGQAR